MNTSDATIQRITIYADEPDIDGWYIFIRYKDGAAANIRVNQTSDMLQAAYHAIRKARNISK